MMDATQQALMQRIREGRFACIDLNIYLDTHPDDEAAKADYVCYSEKLMQLIDCYEAQYGPLMNFGASPTTVGSWVFQPWPWDPIGR